MPLIDEMLQLIRDKYTKQEAGIAASCLVRDFAKVDRVCPVGGQILESGDFLPGQATLTPRNIAGLQDWLRKWYGRSPADIAEIRAAMDPAVGAATEGLRRLAGEVVADA